MDLNEKYNKLINFFKEISKIPRNSKEEGKIAEYLCNFAASRNLWYRKDENNNVLIKKNASKGYENRKTILFQAHTDMVCVKTEDSTHDFKNDEIEIIDDGETLKAKNTTLGADDGIGVAFLMLLLDDNDINLPNIECLFTTEEEIGMNGARAFNYSDIEASYLINLDGEEENTAIVGCAGGVSVNYTKECNLEDASDTVYELNVTGLYGGHSGVDIDKGRINSNYLVARLLNELSDVKIISFVGGTKDNAIANNTKAIFTTSTIEIDKTINSALCKFRFTKEDRNIKVEVKPVVTKNRVMCINKEDSKNILSLIIGLKQNVIEMSKDIKGLVETSGNIGIVKIEEGKIFIVESLRSSIDSKKEDIKIENNNLANKLGFNITEEGSYPGWKYNPNSMLEKVYIDSYKETHSGEEPIVCAIHAGVECGMIYEKLPHLDMISLGPDVKDVHTVNETLYLESCKKMLETLVYMIDKLD
ncbi:MAG: beta-Ala-His dipeptidase [Clostridia bacterium]|nr:beta-Ala-His dipeptidase [Clostridia bacterium]